MTRGTNCTMANMDAVLEETCGAMPHGGDHDIRKFVAAALISATESGHTKVDELRHAARNAMAVLVAQDRVKVR
jgi:hypothetical protein